MWSVALKAPHGRRCTHYRPVSKWSCDGDIDAWVRSTLGTVLHTAPYAWIMYNDEVIGSTEEASPSCGHCKGVLLWPLSKEGDAFWLVHSVPRWPAPPPPGCQASVPAPRGSLENVPDPECIYGQSFAWMPFDVGKLDQVLSHLHVMQAHVYAASSTAAEQAVASVTHVLSPHQWHEMLDLLPGVAHCAKHAEWGRDLYEDGLVPGLFAGRSCAAETWMRPHMGSTPHVRNVSTVTWRMPSVEVAESYAINSDHSKWAVTDADGSGGMTFVGDINRMPSQFHRGGGGFVLSDPDLWKGMSLSLDA